MRNVSTRASALRTAISALSAIFGEPGLCRYLGQGRKFTVFSMPYAITLLLDRIAAGKVLAMYRALSDSNVSHDQIDLGYPLHLTLATLDDTANANDLRTITTSVTRSWRSWRVRFAGFGIFPDTPSTLWLCPIVTSDLLERQSTLCAQLPIFSLRNHYLPERWVPHVTLAKDVSQPSAALAAVQTLDLPTEAGLVEINLIYFRPPKVIWQRSLEDV
jgi:2'-5' RNA ligase